MPCARPAGVWRAHLISRAAETQRFVLAATRDGYLSQQRTDLISVSYHAAGTQPADRSG
jgi:predicted amidohydrolase